MALVIDADMDPAKVSVAADFVDIGIDSLRLTRLASRINAEFDITLTLRPLIENPTVSTLGAVVADLVGAETASRVRVSDVIRPEVIPASFGQQSLWLMDQMSGPTDQYIVPIVVPLVGEVDIPALAAAIGDVVIRHETLRTLLVADDRVVVRQEIVPPAAISERLLIDIVDGSGWDPSRVHTVLREQMLVPFSLGVDLPIRALLIETGDGAVMGLGVHHSALDEWSIPAMHRDMVAGYLARTAGAAPVWEPSPPNTPTTRCGSGSCWAGLTTNPLCWHVSCSTGAARSTASRPCRPYLLTCRARRHRTGGGNGVKMLSRPLLCPDCVRSHGNRV